MVYGMRIGTSYSTGYGSAYSTGYGYASRQTASNLSMNIFGMNSDVQSGMQMADMYTPYQNSGYSNAYNNAVSPNLSDIPIYSIGANRPLSLGGSLGTSAHNTNIFATGHNYEFNTNPFAARVNGGYEPTSLSYRRTSAGFGSLTSKNALNIHTPSVDYRTREFDANGRHISKTNISGDIDSYRRTSSLLHTGNGDLKRTKEVIETPTETITRTRTRGTLWV